MQNNTSMNSRPANTFKNIQELTENILKKKEDKIR